LETDRGAVLTLRAAARGVIDFSKARVDDVRWWRRTNVLIKTMSVEDDMVAVRAAFDLQRSLVGNSGLTDKSFEASQKTAKALFGDIVEVLYPWSSKESAARKAGEIEGLINQYKQLVGDPNDPEFQKKLEHDYEVFKNQDSAVEVESDSERIDRLMQEREARYNAIRGN
jgi:hypothetical protein